MDVDRSARESWSPGRRSRSGSARARGSRSTHTEQRRHEQATRAIFLCSQRYLVKAKRVQLLGQRQRVIEQVAVEGEQQRQRLCRQFCGLRRCVSPQQLGIVRVLGGELLPATNIGGQRRVIYAVPRAEVSQSLTTAPSDTGPSASHAPERSWTATETHIRGN